MTDPHDELAAAMHRLRGEVRERVPMPAPARLRARAIRRLRVRRTTTALVAAVAVAALVLGGGTLLDATATPPEPADTPTPSVSPTPAVVAPSPRPEPRPAQTIDDPIADVDWQNATVSMGAWEGCPGGFVDFVPVSDVFDNAIGPPDSYPAMLLDANTIAYGDLNGDGAPEATMQASCVSSAEGNPTDIHLIVVTRHDDGTLTALGWAGPDGAARLSWWVADGRLLVSVDDWSADVDEHSEESVRTAAGQVLAYEWEGELGFVGGDPAPEYPPVLPLDPADVGPPLRPGAAVAAGLGCPDQAVRFRSSIDDLDFPWLGLTDTDARYALPPSEGPYLFDLDRTGQRLLVLALSCLRPDGTTSHGLTVFERADAGWQPFWQGISVLVSPSGSQPEAWSMVDDRFTVEWADGLRQEYRWSGAELIAVDE